MKRLSFTSQTVTRLAFGVVIVFVLAQVLWWVIFQQRYTGNVTQTTLEHWQASATTANLLMAQPTSGASVRRQLEESYPHLVWNGERFEVGSENIAALRREQRGYLRMFVFEASVFVLVVLAGLYIIALNLRSERELKRRQQNFLSAITHEFKTPLSTLRLLLETVLFRPLPAEKQRRYLERMEEELSRLEQTSEQVLASARLEQSEQAPALQSLELNSVVQGIIGKARSGLEARGAVLTVTYSPEALPVSLDASAFSVVLNNLLDNAVKYSPGTEKIVMVRLEHKSDLIFTHVEDRGVGIKESEAGHIFDRFYRTGNEMTRESTGVGLGLHLVKTITEAMNGWVRCEPNPAGEGTRFTVVLPKRVSLTTEEQTESHLQVVQANQSVKLAVNQETAEKLSG